MKSIEIPKEVTEIGESAFRDCTSLESVTFEAGREEDASLMINGNAFRFKHNTGYFLL